MLQNIFSIRQFRLTKWSFLVHSTTRNAPYIDQRHDSILELWRTFPNELVCPYDKVMPQSHTADQPTAPRVRATDPQTAL